MYEAVYDELCALTEIYSALLALAREKRPVLQANKDYEAMKALTSREEALLKQAAEAERLRGEAVASIASTKGVPAQSLNIAALSRFAGGVLGARIHGAGVKLAGLLQELQGENALNRQLLEMNLSFVSFMLDALAGKENVSSIYGASGGEADEGPEIYRFLDSEV